MNDNLLHKSAPPRVESFDFGGLGVVWKLDAAESGGRFSVVHHPLAPRALAAPLHRHHREDEFSYVLRGRLGALLGERVVTAGPGEWVRKLRHEWHTFWNAGDAPCEIIEIISPGGFEDFFSRSRRRLGRRATFHPANPVPDHPTEVPQPTDHPPEQRETNAPSVPLRE
jgi:mannose-6-phosphate isomerase-like protein (cupin superfamily)